MASVNRDSATANTSSRVIFGPLSIAISHIPSPSNSEAYPLYARIVAINNLVAKGRTPYAKNFNATYNDPQSPWISTFRGALFGTDPEKALDEGAAKLTASLQKS